MRKLCLLLIPFSLLVATSCNYTKSGALFSGSEKNDRTDTGDVAIEGNTLSLSGENSSSTLKKGNYTNFELQLEARTSEGGKGFVGIHTDESGKGYRIAINNDTKDPVWWRMTGSLLSVRNLTKSFVKENDWFGMTIGVKGRLITVKINDEPVVEYIEPADPYRTEANAKSVLSQGTFSLVSTGSGTIQFRNISVNVLDGKSIDSSTQLQAARDEQTDKIIRLHQDDFPVLDYHVHLKGGLTKEAAAIQSRETGINYTVAPNCGIGFPITSDEEVFAYLDTMRNQPFILAMQGEGREWSTTFSEEARDGFDFVFTDALTFTDQKDRRVRLWVDPTVIIDDEQKYMDLIVDRTCDVLKEPADVFVNPFFLPNAMKDRYDELWTEKRMDKVIRALAESGKALEINELYNIPSKAILLKAKAAGVKFTFGSNNVTPEVSDLGYSIRMKEACGLTAKDMYKPKIKL